MKELKLKEIKKNPDYKPGNGMKNWLDRESKIDIVELSSLAIGDEVVIVHNNRTCQKVKVKKVRYDGSSFEYQDTVTLSERGNPFGARSGANEWKGLVFPSMDMAEKYRERKQEEIEGEWRLLER